MSVSLPVIYDEIQSRVDAIEGELGPWPCGVGCDHCCRHLHRVPEATASEWRRFERGLATLDDRRRAGVLARVAALDGAPGQVTCPALDVGAGRCLVYADRPAACRSYGYYRGRAHDLWCHRVEAHVAAAPAERPVVFGNQDALEARLQRDHGPRVSMIEWFAGRPPT